jgi:RNA polymerase sigma-70 factor, ECF subfamily
MQDLRSSPPEDIALADADLVRDALRDTAHFAVIVRKYSPALRRYIVRLLGHHARNADDVLQDVFIKTYINLNDYDQRRAFAPWIYRIAHNEAIDQLRRNKPEQHAIGGDDGAMLLDNIASHSNAEFQPGLAKAIQHAFAQLQPIYRDVLILRLFEEQGYDEISEILAIPAGTVAIRIKRGLERLQASLHDWKV